MLRGTGLTLLPPGIPPIPLPDAWEIGSVLLPRNASRSTPTDRVDDAPLSIQEGRVMLAPPRRGGAYQPRVKPWVRVRRDSGVLKERRIRVDRRPIRHPRLCGVPSERGGFDGKGSQGVALGWYAVSRWDMGDFAHLLLRCPGLLNLT